MGYPIFHSQYTAAQIEASVGKSPRINPTTKTWEVWDIGTSAYVDTGVDADAQDAADRAEAAATTAVAAKTDAETAQGIAIAAADRAEAAAATLTVDSALSDSSTNPVQNKVITAEIIQKLDVDGYSALATVGNAEQLVSTIRTIDNAPYLTRIASGSIGNREYDTIVGGNVVHNQLVTNGNFSEGDDGSRGWQPANGTLTVTDGVAKYEITGIGTNINNHIRATDGTGGKPNARINWLHGHKYLFAFTHRENMGDGTRANSRLIRFSYIASPDIGMTLWTSEEWRRSYAVVDFTGASAREWYGIRLISDDRQVGDWFEVRNAIIVDLTAMFGINIANYIHTLEQNSAGSGIYWLKRYGFLTNDYYTKNSSALASVKLLSHKIIGVDFSHVYPLDSTLTLNGLLKLDADNNLYFDGDIYPPDGMVDRRYSIVNLGLLDWVQGTDGQHTYYYTGDLAGLAAVGSDTTVANILSEKYPAISAYDFYSSWPDKSIALFNNAGVAQLWIVDSAMATVEELTTALDDVKLVFEVVTPTIDTADPYQTPQIVEPLSTEQYDVPTQLTDFKMPVGHVTQYPVNLRAELEKIVRKSPELPTVDGIYSLKCVIAGGESVVSWIADE